MKNGRGDGKGPCRAGRDLRVPRMTADLQGLGHRVNHKKVERLMRENGIVAVHERAWIELALGAL